MATGRCPGCLRYNGDHSRHCPVKYPQNRAKWEIGFRGTGGNDPAVNRDPVVALGRSVAKTVKADS